jgi:polysaccharide export outer membrane protein
LFSQVKALHENIFEVYLILRLLILNGSLIMIPSNDNRTHALHEFMPAVSGQRLSQQSTNRRVAAKVKNSFQIEATIVVAIGAAFVSLLCSGCHQPAAPLPEQMAAPTSVSLISGDVVKLTFPGAPELNQSQKIRADGKINLPLIGEVDAAGKSIGSLQNELALRYQPQLQNTTVVVTLESSVTQVVVSGAVSKPAKLLFERPTTVFQAIMEAGGVNEYGNLGKVHLIRVARGVQHTQILDLRPTMSGRTTRAFYVRDGDVVYVPASAF